MADNPYAPPRSPSKTRRSRCPTATSSRTAAACRPATVGVGSRTPGPSWASSAGRSSACSSCSMLINIVRELHADHRPARDQRCSRRCSAAASARLRRRAARAASRGRAPVRGLSTARRQARGARRDLARVRIVMVLIIMVDRRLGLRPARFSAPVRTPTPEQITEHVAADAAGGARRHGVEPAAVDGDVVRAAADRAGRVRCRAGAEDELPRVPEEHPAVSRLERADPRPRHSRVDPVVPRLVVARPRLDGVDLHLGYRDIFHESEESSAGDERRTGARRRRRARALRSARINRSRRRRSSPSRRSSSSWRASSRTRPRSTGSPCKSPSTRTGSTSSIRRRTKSGSPFGPRRWRLPSPAIC